MESLGKLNVDIDINNDIYENPDKYCQICLLELDAFKSSVLSCKHRFHDSCLNNSFKNFETECPYCRTIIEDPKFYKEHELKIMKYAKNMYGYDVKPIKNWDYYMNHVHVNIPVYIAEGKHSHKKGFIRHSDHITTVKAKVSIEHIEEFGNVVYYSYPINQKYIYLMD